MKLRLSLLLACLVTTPVGASPEIALPLAELPHIHGVEFDPNNNSLLLATHYGIYRFRQGGPVVLISPDRSDYMGFLLTSEGTAIASGHPENGGNLGVIASPDLGASWTLLSAGAEGPVDFHAIAAASADSDVMFGLYQGGIQSSVDGGKTWQLSGEAPQQTIDLAVSPNGRQLFAATAKGVQVSEDSGRTWSPIAGDAAAPTSVIAMFGTDMFAYSVGDGLLVRGAGQEWTVRSPDMGQTIPLHLAQDPANPDHLVAVTQESVLIESMDGGVSWSPLE